MQQAHVFNANKRSWLDRRVSISKRLKDFNAVVWSVACCSSGHRAIYNSQLAALDVQFRTLVSEWWMKPVCPKAALASFQFACALRSAESLNPTCKQTAHERHRSIPFFLRFFCRDRVSRKCFIGHHFFFVNPSTPAKGWLECSSERVSSSMEWTGQNCCCKCRWGEEAAGFTRQLAKANARLFRFRFRFRPSESETTVLWRTRGDTTLQTKVGSAKLYIRSFRGEPRGSFACNLPPVVIVEEL